MSKIQFFELKIDVVKANYNEENVDAFLSWKLTCQSGRDFKSHSDFVCFIEGVTPGDTLNKILPLKPII